MHELFPVGESDLTAAVITAARGLPGVMTTVLLRIGDPETTVMASCLTIHGDTAETHVLIVLRELDGRGAAVRPDDAHDATSPAVAGVDAASIADGVAPAPHESTADTDGA